MKTPAIFAVVICAVVSTTAQPVNFPPPSFDRVLVPGAAGPVIHYPIGINNQGEVLFWTRQTATGSPPTNKETYSAYKWSPGAANSTLLAKHGSDTQGPQGSTMPRHGFNDAGQFGALRPNYVSALNQVGVLELYMDHTMGIWAGAGWQDIWTDFRTNAFGIRYAPLIGPTYPGYPAVVYDVNSAGDMIFAGGVNATVGQLLAVGGGVQKFTSFAGTDVGAIYQASSDSVRFFFLGTSNMCTPLRINAAGVAVGMFTDVPADYYYQFKWRGFIGTFATGATEFAPISPRGGLTQPSGINSAGDIVGFSGTFPLGWAPFIYLTEAKYGLSAGLHEIAPPSPSVANPTTFTEGNRHINQEAQINDLGEVIFNYHSSSLITPGFWQLGHQWTLTSLVANFSAGQTVGYAQDINNRGQILVELPTGQTAVLNPLLASRLRIESDTCPGGVFTLRLTVTNQSGRSLTQLAAPLLEWNGAGTFTIVTPAAVSGPNPLLNGQTADITWQLQLSGASADGTFVSQCTSRDPTNGIVNSLLAQSPPIGNLFHTDVTALPNRTGIGTDIEVRVTAVNGTTKTLQNVHPAAVPTTSVAGVAQFKSGPVPAGNVTLNPGASFTFTNIFVGTNTGTVKFTANVVGTCDGSPITATAGTSDKVRVSDRGDLLIKRAEEPGSRYGIDSEYQSIASGAQVRTNYLEVGKISQFNIKVLNHETNSRTFVLKADASGNLGWDVKYLLNNVDITASLTAAGGGSLPALAAGESHVITLQVRGTNTIAGDFKLCQLVLSNPLELTESLDTVKAVTIMTGEIIVNTTGDEPDADVNDNLPDVDLVTAGLQTTLRCAIDFANRRPAADIIKFQIPASDVNYNNGAPLIQPETALPDVTGTVIIDGWSQNTNSATPPIELEGTKLANTAPDARLLSATQAGAAADLLVGAGVAHSGLVINASDCEVRGLAVNHFLLAGLEINGANCVVQGNYFGTDASGTILRANGAGQSSYPLPFAKPNSGDGSEIAARGCGLAVRSANNLIGGLDAHTRNLFSGHGQVYYFISAGHWVEVDGFTQSDDLPSYTAPLLLIQGSGAVGNRILGNVFGLDASGLNKLVPPVAIAKPHVITISPLAGIFIDQAPGTIVGGTEAGAGNAIVGTAAGVWALHAPQTQVMGNRIGLNVNSQPVSSLGAKSESGIIGDGDMIIGGSTPAEANLIVVDLNGASVGDHSRVEGNTFGIGPGKSSSTRRGVDARGIGITVQSNRFWNCASGIRVGGSNNVVQANTIIGNSDRVFNDVFDANYLGIVVQSAHGIGIFNNVISQTANGGINVQASQAPCTDIQISGNQIDRNHGPGVLLEQLPESPPSLRVSILNNRITENDGLGISFGDGLHPTINDSAEFDADSGPNTLLNMPLISSAIQDSSGRLDVSGLIQTALGTHTYRLQFFVNSLSPYGFGEGERFLGETNVTTGVAGSQTFTFSTIASVDYGVYVSATATDADGDTSEFSRAALVQSSDHLELDGMSNPVENRSPSRNTNNPAGDGNGDGIADAQQGNVTSFPSVGGGWWTLAAKSGATFNNVQPGGQPDTAPPLPGYTFPFGFVSFTLTNLTPGATVVVTNIIHTPFTFSAVFAFGPTPGTPQPHWYNLNFTTAGDEVRINFTDGTTGDHDLSVNGSITTTYALAFQLPPVPQLVLLSATPRLDNGLNAFMQSVLAWPATATDYAIEYSHTLVPAEWLPVPGEAVIVGNQFFLTNNSFGPSCFFRLTPRPTTATVAGVAAPSLNIQPTGTNTLLLSWLSSFTGFTLQQNTDLNTSTWTSVTNPVSVVNTQNHVVLAPAPGTRFFRLKLP